MDDDIRDRFRSTRRPSQTPFGYGRSARPAPAPQRPVAPPRPAPTPSPHPISKPAPAWQPSPKPVSKPAPVAAKPAPKPAKARKKRGSKKKFIFLLVLFLFLAGGGAGAWALKFRKQSPAPTQTVQNNQTQQTETTPKPTGTIRFIAIGDNLAFDSINTAAKKSDETYDYLPMMLQFKPFFEKADIRLCTETTPGGGDKDGLGISGYPNFNAPLAWSTSFASLGCNVVNLATAHAYDKGQTAVDSMRASWDSQKSVLAVAGANRTAEEQSKINYFTVKGVKFAYLAYTTSSQNNNGIQPHSINFYSDTTADKQIAEARKNADLVLVSMTWEQANNSSDISGDQDRIAQHLADQNVDVVIGAGPQALQPAKILSGTENHQTLVWFSLGNFLNSELLTENLIGGMAVMDFDAATGTLKDPKLMPVYMHYEWTAAQKAAGTVNARHDFMLYPLDLAAPALAKSQLGTTVEAQTSKVTSIITKFAPIKVIKSSEY